MVKMAILCLLVSLASLFIPWTTSCRNAWPLLCYVRIIANAAELICKIIFKSTKAPEFESDADKLAGKTSIKHQEWLLQDYNLCSWLLSSLDDEFKNQMVKCASAYQIWDQIQQYFISSNKTKLRQFKNQLKNVKKLNLSAKDYLIKVKKLVDSLSPIGHSLSSEDHIEAICLKIITTVRAKPEMYTVGEVEALLTSHEDLLEKFKQTTLGLAQSNYAQSASFNSFSSTRGFDTMLE
ncbi:hypothetical protein Ahy_B04g072755 isoform A [Arachis hypogaea]|uniref:Retrotransposon gag domain-containing protein n=1 Tax=Arachis hypogaea TaxID=3818 RepID=A0A444ZNM9_ARAHY|nr:hypothetical protein Ahy_B04g072755 isoform A [Arachis hypogaea]